jgi:nicotinamide phosphoribosyltransferase
MSEEIENLYNTFLPEDIPKVVFFGQQMFIKEYLTTPITHEDVDSAVEIATAHGFDLNEEGWRYIVDTYDGILPVRIKSVREGTAVPLSNILASIESTDPNCFWLTSYLETAYLRAIWYPTTIASKDLIAKKIIKKYMDKTSDYEAPAIDFMLHDFGARGVSSLESAAIGGVAHLVFFQGTDTISGTLAAMKYYDADMAGFSIPASEHSTMTAWGEDRESKAYANMITQFGGEGKVLACVSDSYDIYNATENIWGEELKDLVEKSGGTLVVRPDSGDPLTVPLEIIELLMEKFGYTVNSKGYKVLPDCVRVIQGDGITITTMAQILDKMDKMGFAANNIAFGMGAGMLQKVDRDTFKFAMKCSAAEIGGQWIDVFKDPVGSADKKSKKGKLTLVEDVVSGTIRTISINDSIDYDEHNIMDTYYMNGAVESMYTNFVSIRSTAARYV